MTLQSLESELRVLLKSCEQPALEARAILLALAARDAADLLANYDRLVSAAVADQARDWARRRNEGYPLAYLTGKRGFYKYEFAVAPGVLVPRPETELAVEIAIQLAPGARTLADLGCGTGCLGLSVLAELPLAELFAVDSSPLAAKLTRQNSILLGLGDRVEVITSEVEKFQPPRLLDLIVTNPPYIAIGDTDVSDSVHKYEPHAALYSGEDGLTAIRSWTAWSSRHLKPGGVLVCEIGSRQSRNVREIIENAGFENIQSAKDLAGFERVVSASRRSDQNG